MRFLFDINIENFEWGYQNIGILITDSGIIYKYDITRIENKFKRNTYEDKLKYSTPIFYLSSQCIEKLSNLLIGVRSQLTNNFSSNLLTRTINYTCYLPINNSIKRINISPSPDENSYEYQLYRELKNIVDERLCTT